MPGTCGRCWPRGGCRSAGSRPNTSWSTGRCWRPITTCAASTPPRRSCAVFFHQGAPRLSEDALRSEQGLARSRAAAAAHLSPAGQLQAATALDMLAAVARTHRCASSCWRPPGISPAPGYWRRGCMGPARTGSPPPARRSGSPGWTSPCTPPTAKDPSGGCPGRGRRCCAGRCMRPADPRPRRRPRPRLLRRGQGPQEQASAPPCRRPQDRPAGLPHPGRARRRRAHRRLSFARFHGDHAPRHPGPGQARCSPRPRPVPMTPASSGLPAGL
jgi:hypothetical protein